MQKAFFLLLIICLCVSLCACDFFTIIDSESNTNHSQNTTEPIYEPPAKHDAIIQYLSSRYEGEFECVSYEDDQEVLYYKSSAYSQLIKVYEKEALWLDGYDIALYTGNFADNGYYAVTYSDAYQYYWQFFDYIPGTSMVMKYSGDVLPSSIKADMPFAEAKLKYPQYFTPTIYLLREELLLQEQLDSLKQFIESAGEKIAVYIVIADKEDWNDASIEQFQKQPLKYQLRQYFETFVNTGG